MLTKRVDEQNHKREAAPSYPSTSGHYPSSSHSAVSFQSPSVYQQSSYQPQQAIGGHTDAASAISVGAGYSIGGAKPSFSYAGSGLEGLQSSGQSIKLAPITLQPNQGLVGTDLEQIMSQLQQSLNSGALTLQPSSNIAEFHVNGQASQDSNGQLSYGSPNLQQYVLGGSVQSAPSYAAGTKGLSSYGSTGPVLFSPSTQAVAQGSPADLSLSALSTGQSYGEASPHGIRQSFLSLGSGQKSSDGISYGSPVGLSLGGHSFGSGITLGNARPSFGGLTYEGAAGQHSFGGSGQSLGGSALSHNFGQSLGPAQPQPSFYKLSSGKYGHGAPGKSFRPSAFLGAVASGESSGISGISEFPTFSSLSGSQGHSFAGYGSPSKAISPLFTRTDGHSAHDSASAYSNLGHLASPPGTTYGFPTASYPAESAQAASSVGPQHYSAKYPSNFKGHFSYKSASPYSAGPKYLSGGHGHSHGPSARYSSSEDSNGAYSENAYNTIKYSEELKPRN